MANLCGVMGKVHISRLFVPHEILSDPCDLGCLGCFSKTGHWASSCEFVLWEALSEPLRAVHVGGCESSPPQCSVGAPLWLCMVMTPLQGSPV